MAVEMREDEDRVDLTLHCGDCVAVCCRLLVILGPDDQVPLGLAERNQDGLDVMRRGADGWCLALQRTSMRCGIYASRPGACRRFAMGAGHCRAIREDYHRQVACSAAPSPLDHQPSAVSG